MKCYLLYIFVLATIADNRMPKKEREDYIYYNIPCIAERNIFHLPINISWIFFIDLIIFLCQYFVSFDTKIVVLQYIPTFLVNLTTLLVKTHTHTKTTSIATSFTRNVTISTKNTNVVKNLAKHSIFFAGKQDELQQQH